MNIIIIGVLGRMGRAIVESAKAMNIHVVCGVDTEESKDFGFPVYTSTNDIVESANCIIDFSSPCMLEHIGHYALERKLPVVFGTTGYSKEQLDYIQTLSTQVPVLQSYNMSLGVQVLKRLCEQAKKILGSLYDVEIIEKHHNQKKDAPSGTALMLYDAIKTQDSVPIFGRKGLMPRTPNEIGLHAVRGGAVPGEHEVDFLGQWDDLSLVHRVRNRQVFAQGALVAAQFLIEQPIGRYATSDMIDALLQN